MKVKNNNEEKAAIMRMPTHNLANSHTPDHKQYIHAKMKHLKLQLTIIPIEDAIVHTHWSDHLKLSISLV